MEINKQLFEDVLSGKLKGTFVLRNGKTYFSDDLHRNYNIFRDTHPYAINRLSYTPKGRYSEDFTSMLDDIVDFIPETNMKENELTIEIPNNKVVDWEESKKQNKIVLKDKQLTYSDICKELFNGGIYYINTNGEIYCSANIIQHVTDPNNATTKHQLECILAKNKLANVAKYLNNGWKPVYNVQYPHLNENVWIISNTLSGIYPKEIMQNSAASSSGTIFFKTKELAQQAIEILGEETVKLALEPLGI